MHLLFNENSPNHEISVYDTTELFGEKGSFRILQFSKKAVQGAIDINNPKRILFEYPRAIIHLMEFNSKVFENVFVIGHGIGTISAHFPAKRFKVAEIDEQVVDLSKQFFNYYKKDVFIGDGRELLTAEKPHTYDYIILDAFTEKGTPRHLTSKEFFKIAKSKLDTQGSLIMNLIGRGGNDKQINAIHTTFSKQFKYIKAYILPSEDVSDILNFIIVGSNKPIGAQIRYMAGFIETKLNLGHIIEDID